MRTKSRAVRRNTSEQTIGDQGSVSADSGLVSTPVTDALVQTYVDASSFEPLLNSDRGGDIGMTDMLESLPEGIMIPEIASDGMTGVDTSFDYTNVSRQRPLPSAGANCTWLRPSNGVAIREPDPARPMRHDRFPMSIDVVGKGKRKMDDISMFTENDSCDIGAYSPRCMSSSGHIACIRLIYKI